MPSIRRSRAREHLAAFRHAADLGYRYLETDVHVTSDDVLLAFHDDVLDRVTDRTGPLSETSYAEVQAALIGAGARAALAELFEAFPEARFNIDVKSDGAVERLVEFIAGAMPGPHLIGSFSEPTGGSAGSRGDAWRRPRTPARSLPTGWSPRRPARPAG